MAVPGAHCCVKKKSIKEQNTAVTGTEFVLLFQGKKG